MKITILSIVIGLKNSYFHLFTCQVVIGQFNKPITFKVVVCIDQTHSKLQFKSTNHNLGSNHNRTVYSVRLLCQSFNTNFFFLPLLGHSSFLGNFNFSCALVRFVITRLNTDRIGFHSVLLPLQIHRTTNIMYTAPFLYSRLYI